MTVQATTARGRVGETCGSSTDDKGRCSITVAYGFGAVCSWDRTFKKRGIPTTVGAPWDRVMGVVLQEKRRRDDEAMRLHAERNTTSQQDFNAQRRARLRRMPARSDFPGFRAVREDMSNLQRLRLSQRRPSGIRSQRRPAVTRYVLP
jgi:hypothetical protein